MSWLSSKSKCCQFHVMLWWCWGHHLASIAKNFHPHKKFRFDFTSCEVITFFFEMWDTIYCQHLLVKLSVEKEKPNATDCFLPQGILSAHGRKQVSEHKDKFLLKIFIKSISSRVECIVGKYNRKVEGGRRVVLIASVCQ